MFVNVIKINCHFFLCDLIVTFARAFGQSMKTRPRETQTPVVTDDATDSDTEVCDAAPEEAIGKPQKILAWRQSDSGREFLTKFNGRPYNECQWHPEVDFNATRATIALLRRYLARLPPESVPPFFDESYLVIEKLIGIDGDRVLVKWTGLDYDEATWESVDAVPKKLITELTKRDRLPSLEERFLPPRPKASDWRPVKEPKISRIRKLVVKPYQLEGLNFLVKAWYEGRNAILADEMGLGKTLQSCVFMDYLAVTEKMKGPFLVVAPLSTIAHWEREIEEWTTLKSISYYGISQRRKLLKKYEMFHEGTHLLKCDVVITTYEYAIKEQALLSEVRWRALVVDEAHRMKNRDSKLVSAMRLMDTDFKLLLTGTPLQNNTEELWTLLNFIDTNAFEDLNDFQSRFGELSESEQIVELKSLLKPLMLRRRKGDVEKAIAPLEEIIVECPMTPHQRAYYKNIYSKNLEYLTRGLHAQGNSTNLKNVFMELRKVCNHPYLINGAEDQILVERRAAAGMGPEVGPSIEFENDSLIKSAGKMVLLDKLLAKLKADGHRVLIFSQMTRMLDILQDYLNYRGYLFQRIDGSVRGDLRQVAIDNFNAPGSPDFVFLLCTKAGGVGINLTSADRVIIYDSDWNPQNDIQATARCHRIGQTKEVKMFRFITAKSYERKMFDRASVKLGLDRAVLESETKAAKTEEMEKLLRLGAYYAFEEETGETEKFGEEDIDVILSRSRRITHENAFGDGGNFSVAQFELDEADNNVDLEDPNFWQKYLPEVIEDDIELEGVSIAERKRLMRESGSTEDVSQADAPIEEDSYSSFSWNKSKLQTLQSTLLKFGWGRWRAIHEKSGLKCSIGEMKSVCFVILKWIIDASEEKNPLVESIFSQANTAENQEFARSFIKRYRKKLLPVVSSGWQWKLARFDALYFLNQAVTTCPNAPEGLVIPDTGSNKPAEWWTENDDKALVYGAWKEGFQQYNDITFSNNEAIPQMSTALTNRLKQIIKGLKALYVRIKERDPTAAFNYETLQQSKHAWSKKDHKTVCQALVTFGYPSAKRFKEFTQLNKDEAAIDEYVTELLSSCEEAVGGNTPEPGNLAEVPTSGVANRILKRVAVFHEARSRMEDPSALKEEDRNLLEHIDKYGLANAHESPLLVDRFGTEGLEGKVLKRLKDVSRIREFRLSSSQRTIEHQLEIANQKAGTRRKVQRTLDQIENESRTQLERLIDRQNEGEEEEFEEGSTQTKGQKTVQDIVRRTIRASGQTESGRSRGSLLNYAIPKIEMNEDGTPKLPLKIGKSLIIVDLGTVVYDRPRFHNERYLYPDGYTSEHLYPSLIDPLTEAWWRSTIIDRGGDGPVFRVEMKEEPSIFFEGPSPSTPWVLIVKAVEERKKELGMPGNRSLTISGPECYGLSSAAVLCLMHTMPNADKCVNFRNPAPAAPAAPEAAPQVTEKRQAPPRTTPQAPARQRSKACLVLRLGHVVQASNHTSVPEFAVDTQKLLQRDFLDVSVPFDDNPIMTAIERMIPKVESCC